eukprot:jgi/Chlat1/4015/Chrsp26S04084
METRSRKLRSEGAAGAAEAAGSEAAAAGGGAAAGGVEGELGGGTGRSLRRIRRRSLPLPPPPPPKRVRRQGHRSGMDENKESDRRAEAVDEDEEDDPMVGGSASLHRNLASASSSLQGLLRKLGAGLDLMPTHSTGHGRLRTILSGLRAEGEEHRQLEALSNLCELLSIGTEESLSNFSVDQFVPVLVNLLNQEYNPDVMILAARALTHLIDVLPSSCAAVVHHGAVPAFCARLLTIEYIDLAEQSLQALEKISHEHPAAVLRAGGLMAVLSFLDFFPSSVQRVAVSTAANICRNLTPDLNQLVLQAAPMLTGLLQHHDAKVVEHAITCLTRLATSCVGSPEKVETLCSQELISEAMRLISTTGGNQVFLSPVTTASVTRLLATCAGGSPVVAQVLLENGITRTIKDTLSNAGFIASISASPSSVARPSDQLYEMVSLANELLPPLPESASLLSPTADAAGPARIARRPSTRTTPATEDDDTAVTAVLPSPKEVILRLHPQLLQQFLQDLSLVLLQVFSATTPAVRHKCLSALHKLLYFATPEMLQQSAVQDSPIASFISSLVLSKDATAAACGVQFAELLMEKLPKLFAKPFVREGVVHALDTLAASAPPVTSSTPRGRRSASSGRRSPTEPGGRPASYPPAAASLNGAEGALPRATPRTSALRTAAASRANYVKTTFFKEAHGAADIGTEGVRQLRQLGARLTSKRDSEEKKMSALFELLALLNGTEGVSTFEVIGSGVVAALRSYLTGTDLGSKQDADVLLQRLLKFSELALSKANCGRAPGLVLVRKLQEVLASVEKFPVYLSRAPRSIFTSMGGQGTSANSSGLSALMQPFKLRLCRAPQERNLRDYSTNIVLIEPLATLGAVEDFLWPRVRRHDTSPQGIGTPQVAASASPSAPLSDSPSAGPSTPGVTTRAQAAAAAAAAASASTGHEAAGKAAASATEPSPSLTASKGDGGSSARRKGKNVATPSDVNSPRAVDKELERQKRRLSAVLRRAGAAARRLEAEALAAELGREIADEDEEDAMPVDGFDLSDDDEDMDDDDALEDDALKGDDLFDDKHILPTAEHVHDVQLGVSSSEDDATQNVAVNLAPSAAATLPTKAGGLSALLGQSTSSGASGSVKPSSFAAAAAGHASRSAWDRKLVSKPRLQFYLDGQPLEAQMSIFQAIQRQARADDTDDEGGDLPTTSGRSRWDSVFTISYSRYQDDVAGVLGGVEQQDAVAEVVKTRTHLLPSLDALLLPSVASILPQEDPSYDTLQLLRLVELLSRSALRLQRALAYDVTKSVQSFFSIDKDEFLNSKLTSKLVRQLQDVLTLCSGSLPDWCPQLLRACPSLFPFEWRCQYFYCTALGLSRALQRLRQQQTVDTTGGNSDYDMREFRMARLQRQKVRVSRSRILDSVMKVMELYSSHKAVLEVEYFGEVGTGLGPTLEFYTLVSHELQKRSLNMWRSEGVHQSADLRKGAALATDTAARDIVARDEDAPSKTATKGSTWDASKYVVAPFGLFPAPIARGKDVRGHSDHDAAATHKVSELFKLLGRVIAKAFQDGRLLDVPLSAAFYKLMLGQELDLYDIRSFDPAFGATLEEMMALSHRHCAALERGERPSSDMLLLRGAPVEALCLDFTLPGQPDYELKPNGADISVTVENLHEYVELVVDATVKSGIAEQLDAFTAGFNQVFALKSLQVFSAEELEAILCGSGEQWTVESLAENIKFDHGYNSNSPPIRQLMEILSEFTPEEQRHFLRFVTGAPRLPPGGLAGLAPKLTIVRKHPTGAGAPGTTPPNVVNALGTPLADGDLPSVMTCANYLKLPPYSCKEIMRERLLYAISEGQGSFDLS